jgi:hypothetical protein
MECSVLKLSNVFKQTPRFPPSPPARWKMRSPILKWFATVNKTLRTPRSALRTPRFPPSRPYRAWILLRYFCSFKQNVSSFKQARIMRFTRSHYQTCLEADLLTDSSRLQIQVDYVQVSTILALVWPRPNSISYHMHLNHSALARENKLRASMQLRFECEVNWILVERILIAGWARRELIAPIFQYLRTGIK